MESPRFGGRQISRSNIVSKKMDLVQRERQQNAPDDARNMSPRRKSEDIETLERCVRESVKE
jgi:hypothetical protein